MNVGTSLQDGTKKAWKSLTLFCGMAVYIGMLLYSGVHNYSLMTRGVSEDMLIWAILGVVALEISAAALPIALHYWTHAPMHRIAAYAFYAVDLGLIFLNVVLDFALTAGGAMPEWMAIYLFYGVPSTPVIAGLGWSVLFLLDPASRELAIIENLRAATRESLAVRIAEQAKATDVTDLVDRAAQEMTRALVADTLGQSVAASGRPAGQARGRVYIEDPEEQPARQALPAKRQRTVLTLPLMRRRSAGTTYQVDTTQPAEELQDPTQPGQAAGGAI